jgi:hypothetical protein
MPRPAEAAAARGLSIDITLLGDPPRGLVEEDEPAGGQQEALGGGRPTRQPGGEPPSRRRGAEGTVLPARGDEPGRARENLLGAGWRPPSTAGAAPEAFALGFPNGMTARNFHKKRYWHWYCIIQHSRQHTRARGHTGFRCGRTGTKWYPTRAGGRTRARLIRLAAAPHSRRPPHSSPPSVALAA